MALSKRGKLTLVIASIILSILAVAGIVTAIVLASLATYKKVTLEYGEGQKVIFTVREDDTFGVPAENYKEGYTFNNWYIDQGCTVPFDFNSLIKDDITIYGKWDPDNTINFYANDGTDEIFKTFENQDYEKPFAVPGEEPTREKYVFKGWSLTPELNAESILYKFGTVNRAFEIPLHGISLYAIWERDEVTIKYDFNGAKIDGRDSKEFVLDRNSEHDIQSLNPKLDGHTFIGWSEDKIYIDGTSVLYQAADFVREDGQPPINPKYYATDNTVLYAAFRQHKVTVTFDPNTTEPYTGEVPDIIAPFNRPVLIPSSVYEREGYSLYGWTIEEDFELGVDDAYVYTPGGWFTYGAIFQDGETVVLHAIWVVKTVEIIFDFGEGTGTLRGIPYRGTEYTTSAQYNVNFAVPNFYVEYKTPTPFFVGFAAELTPDPVTGRPRKSEIFYPGDSILINGDMVLVKPDGTLKVVIEAQYQNSTIFEVNYELNGGITSGGSNRLPTTYVEFPPNAGETTVITLQSLTKKGNSFVGWTTVNGKEGTKIQDIDQYAEGVQYNVDRNITLYAYFVPFGYNVKYNGNGETNGYVADNTTYYYGDNIPLARCNYEKTGYEFVGWALSPDGPAKYTESGTFNFLLEDGVNPDFILGLYQPGSTIEFYAIWETKKYNVTLPTGEGYTITPVDGSVSPVEFGGDFTFKFEFDEGYEKAGANIYVNGVEVSLTDWRYTIHNIKSDIEITVSGVKINTLNVNLPEDDRFIAEAYGISVESTKVDYNGRFLFRIILNEPYTQSTIVVKTTDSRGNTTTLTDVNGVYTINNIIYDQTISVEGVEKNKYTVTLVSGTGYVLETVSGESTATVEYGSNFNFKFVLDERYNLSPFSLLVNDSETISYDKVQPDSTGYLGFLEDIRSDKTITVTGVTINTYTVTLVGGTGYTLTPKAGSASPCNHGDSYTFKFELDAAYTESLYTVYVNGEVVVLNADKEYTITNIKKNITVSVDGVTKNKYEVILPSFDMQTGYSLTAEGNTIVEYGSNLTIVFSLHVEYTKSEYVIKVNGEEITLDAHNKYTITNITSNVVVEVSGVTLNTYKISYLPQPQWTGYTFNFWIGNPDPMAIPYGGDFVFSFSIKPGYDTRDVEVYVINYNDEGVEISRTDVYDDIVAAAGQYTIENITTDLRLEVAGIKTINWNIQIVEPTEGFEVRYLYGYSNVVPSGNDLEFVLELDPAYSLSFPTVYANAVLVNPVMKECKLTENETPVLREVYKLINVVEDQFITVVGVTKNTYQVVIPSSPAYKITTVSGDPTCVEYGGSFEFKVEVSEAYSLSAPSLRVYVNSVRINPDASGVYKISNIIEGQRISIEGLDVNKYNVSFANQAVVSAYFDVFGAVTGQSMEVNFGETFTFELVLKAEYNQSPLSVTVENEYGEDVEIPHSGSTYILADVRKDYVITISGMEINRYQIALPMGTGYVAQFESGNDAEGRVQHGGTVKFYYYVLPLYSDSADQAIVVLNGIRIRPEIQKAYPDLNLTIEEKTWTVETSPGVTAECSGYMFTVTPVENRYQLAISGFKGNTYSVDFEVGVGYKYVNEAAEEFTFFEAAQDSNIGAGTDCIKFKVVLEEKYDNSEIAVIRTDINGDVFTLNPDENGFYSLIDISKHCTISVLDVVVNTYLMKLPETTPGYDIEIRNTSTNPVEHGQSFGFYVKLDEAYTKSAVKVYAKDLETLDTTEVRVSSGIYIIRNITKEYEIIVEGVEINTYTIYTPTTQTGYTLEPEEGQESVVEFGQSYTFNFALLTGYTDSEYLIYVNGELIDPTQIVDGKCTIRNIKNDQIITVAGVELNIYNMTMPTGEGYVVTILNGTEEVTHGKNLSFKITLEDAYKESERNVHVYYAPTNNLADEREVGIYGGFYTITNVTEPLTIKVIGVSVSVYTVTFPAETIGYEITSLSGDAMEVVYGNSFSFTVVLDEIYSNSAAMVKTNGVFLSPDPTTGVYTIDNVKAHQVITVENVKINTYKVTLITGAGYTFNPITTGYIIEHGGSYKFDVTLFEGYTQSVFSVNYRKTGETGTPQVLLPDADSHYVLENITEDKDIFVSGVVLNTYTVTYPKELNQGFVIAPIDGVDTVTHGEVFRFLVQLEDKYNKSQFKVFANGVEVSPTAGQYILSDVRQDVTVEITGIEVNTYTITYPTTQVGYTITTVAGYTTPVRYGENFRFTFVLDEAYSNSAAVRIISVNNIPVSLSGDVCELTNITEDKVVTVTGVTKNLYNVVLATGEGFSLVPVSGSESPVEWGGSYAFKFTLKTEYNQSEYDVLLNEESIKDELLEGGYTITNIKAHQNITVTGVTRNIYSINLPTGIEGCEIVSVTNQNNKIEHGGNFSFKVNLLPAYSDSEIVVKANGVSIYELGGEFTIKNIAENQNVEISGITKNKYTITLKTGEGYDLVAKGSVPNYVEYGDNFTFVFTIKEGYTQSTPVISVNGNQVQLNADGEYEIQFIDENIVVTVTGVQLNKYVITLPTEQTGYMLTPATGNSSPVLHGNNYTFTFALSTAYSKSNAKVKVNGVEVVLNNGQYTIINVTEDKVVTVEEVTLNTYQIIFPNEDDQIGYTLTRTTGEGVVDYGASVVFRFVLDTAYDRSNYIIRVNGLIVSVVFNEFTIENITNDKVITVEGVAINEYTIGLPRNQTGFELVAHTGSISPVKHGGNFTLRFTLLEGYDQSIPNLRIRLDGVEIQEDLTADGLYTLYNVDRDHEVTVEGVKINIYSVTYIYYLGAEEQNLELSVTHGGSIPASDIPNPEGRIGYNFLGWSDVSTNIKSNKTIVANYAIKTYEVIWSAEDADGGSENWGYRDNYETSDEKYAISVVTYGNMYGSLKGVLEPKELIIPIRTGYTFNGWYTARVGGTPIEKNTQVSDIPNRTTYYAHWLAIGITVIFDANGGDGDPPAIHGAIFNHGNKVTADAGGFARSRYTFVGWNLNKNANTGSDSYTVNIADAKREGEEYMLTLYAIWKRDTVKITFNANGGANPPEPTVVNTYEYLILTDAYTATRTGLTFYGWCENQNGVGTIYSTEFGVDRITVENANLTVYAIWAYEINYNKNFPGEEELKTKHSIINKSYQLETVFSVDYYTFVGWSLTPDGEVKYADKYLFEPLKENLNLYGVWIAGYGTEEVPFKVATVKDWNDVVNYYAPNDTIFYQQTEDLVETEELKIIRVKEFAGQYDGNNKKITMIKECAPIDKVMGTAKIKDLEVIANNVYFKTYSYFGSICLNLYGTLENCKNTTDINLTVTSTLYCGGLTAIAYNGSKIINSSNSGSFTIAGKNESYIGGLVGYSDGGVQIDSASNTGNFITTSTSGVAHHVSIGGAVGYLGTTSINAITTFSNTGSFTSTDCVSDIGGIVGYAYNNTRLTMNNINSTGAISTTAPTSHNVGGILGGGGLSVILEITDAYNKGTIYALSASGSNYYTNVGGIVGFMDNNTTVTLTRCYNDGKIDASGAYESYFGGIIGISTATLTTITECYNTGDISRASGYSGSYGSVGGVFGKLASSIVTKSFNIGNINMRWSSGSVNLGGIGGYAGENSNIENCYNTGIVYGDISYSGSTEQVRIQAGGLFGYIYSGSIKKAYNSGYVNIKTSCGAYVGGLVGITQTLTISNAYNISDVYINSTRTDVENNYFIEQGGIIGIVFQKATLNYVYNAGAVNNRFANLASQRISIGGIAGRNEGEALSVSSVAWANDVSGDIRSAIRSDVTGSDIASTGMSEAIIMSIIKSSSNALYSTWDKTNTWTFDSTINNGLPTLRNANSITYDNTITFNSNYGTATTATTKIATNSTVLMPANIFTRSGYTIIGWATTPSATTVQYDTNESVLITGNATFYAVWAKGDGTSTNPYEISTPELWNEFVFNKALIQGVYYKQTADITGTLNVNAVMKQAWDFYGNYDGGNKTMTLTGSSLGLFKTIQSTAQVKNLNLVHSGTLASYPGDVSIGGTYYYETKRGGFASESWGTIDNCSWTVTSLGTFGQTKPFYTGLVAVANTNSSISNTTVEFKDSVSEAYTIYMGGLIGQVNGNTTITNSLVKGAIDYSIVREDAYVGGFVGTITDGMLTINNSKNMLDISVQATGDTYVGGIVGNAQGGSLSISASYNSGNVITTSANSVPRAGGLVGKTASSTTITNCYNAALIDAACTTNNPLAGGLIADAPTTTLTISNSYNIGSVASSATRGVSVVGGLIGYAEGYVIRDSFNLGGVIATSNTAAYAAGIIGSQDLKASSIINNVYAGGKLKSDSSNRKFGAVVGQKAGSSTLTVSKTYWAEDIVINPIDDEIVNFYYGGGQSGASSMKYKNMYANLKDTGSVFYTSATNAWDFSHIWKAADKYNNGIPYLINTDETNTFDIEITFVDNQRGNSSVVHNVAYGSSYITVDTIFNSITYTLVGWSVDNDAVITYSNYSLMYDLKEDRNLYAVWYKGDGSLEHPYEVKDEATWDKFVIEKATIRGLHFKQVTNLTDLQMVPKFYGIYDGNGMTYTITDANPFYELYGTIKNLNVYNGGRTYTADGIGQHIGGIVTVLQTDGRIENCTMKGALTATNVGTDSNAFVGGLVAYVKGTNTSIVNSKNYASITVNGNSPKYVGGLVGGFDSNVVSSLHIDQSINLENINMNIGSRIIYAGGLIGGSASENTKAHSLTITNSYNIGTIDTISTAQQSVGGLVGRLENEDHTTSITIQNSYNAGFINTSTSKATHLGGLIGYGDKITIENSFNIGKLYGYIDSSLAIYLGGLAGYVYNSTTASKLTISNSYNVGIINYVSSSGSTKVGGLVGLIKGTSSSYYDIGITNYYVTNMGTQMTTSVGSKNIATSSDKFDVLYAYLKTPGSAIYNTWSLSVWQRNERYNNSLPFLKTQSADTSTFKVKVSFNRNGKGSGTMNELYVLENSMFIVPAPTYTPPAGEQCYGWMSSHDIGEVEYGINTFVKNLTNNITLYAYWDVAEEEE